MSFRRRTILLSVTLLFLTLSACTYIEDYVPGQATATAPAGGETHAVTATPLPSATPEPTLTATATATLPPTPTPTPTEPPKPYALQPGSLFSMPAFTHSEAGCAWMGVAGQVIGEDGQPVENLVIMITTVQNGVRSEWMGYTGAATAYGPGGYEIQLGNQVSATGYTIQLFDLDGNMLSDIIPFTTAADCQQNLVLINFNPNLNLQPVIYLPVITK